MITQSQETAQTLESLRPFVDLILKNRQVDARAAVEAGLIGREQPFLPIAVDLTNGYTEAAPFEFPTYPFSSLWVYDATDSTCSAKLVLNSKEKQNISNGLTIKKNVAYNSNKQIPVAYLTASAQASKTLYILLIKDGTIDPGTTLSTLAGGINITTGDSMTPGTPVAVTTAATQILAASSTRKNAVIGNPRTSGVDLWISGSGAVTAEGAANPGILLEPGDYYEYHGQGAIYGITAAGNVSATVQTET